MKQVEIEYVSGSSQAGLSGRAVATAALFGSKKGGNQVANWVTGNTKREYKRKRKVWQCKSSCAAKGTATSTPPKQNKYILTREEKELLRIEDELFRLEKLKSDEVRLAEAQARIKELEILDRQNRTVFGWILHYLKEALWWALYFIIGILLVSMFL
jgi:predicted metal-binding protein